MKIDASRYVMFWANPERYRLRELWKISPVPPGEKSMQFKFETGRRRGSMFHEILDLRQNGWNDDTIKEQLRKDGYPSSEFQRAFDMAEVVQRSYPDDRHLAHEAFFEHHIDKSTHSLVGRIDGICEVDGEVLVVDYKTSKYRSKADILVLGDKYCRSAQVGFYLLGARQLGFVPTGFEYRVVSERSNRAGFQAQSFRTNRSGQDLKQLERSVHLTCELIEWLKDEYGYADHWPVVPEQFKTGYEDIFGRKMDNGYIPDGFERKREHLQELAEEEDAVQE